VQVLGVGKWKSQRVEDVDMIVFFPPVSLAYVGLPAYIVARIAILVLAFMWLRNLPDSALKNVDWTNFLPHV
jgi:hypothetical protein